MTFPSTSEDDRPSLSDFPRRMPAHTCWRNGGVECRRCEIEELREERDAGQMPTVAVLLACIFGSLLVLALMKGAEPVVCWMNGDALVYCDGYTAVAK